jgi:hypothetical protein
MQRAEVLREQAELLRKLAESFELPEIRQDLFNLADRCEQLAASVSHELAQRREHPTTGGMNSD